MINVFIGVEKSKYIDFEVLCKSIIMNTNSLVNFVPLITDNIKEYNRPYKNQSTSFTFSRFLVPYLSNYEGWSIFMDSDMLFVEDINNLWTLRNDEYDVMVVKHSYIPKYDTKFFNNPQTNYKMKNWSSLMLFNNSKCKMLSANYVNNSSFEQLHQFHWTTNIGELDKKWNYLVGEYEDEHYSNLHFTYGTPRFSTINTIFDEIWENYATRKYS